MKEIAELVSNYGGLIILACLFIYIFLEDRNDRKDDKEENRKVLNELSKSNNNIAESLNLLKASIDNNTAEYRQHDDRAIKEFSKINEKLVEINSKIK